MSHCLYFDNNLMIGDTAAADEAIQQLKQNSKGIRKCLSILLNFKQRVKNIM